MIFHVAFQKKKNLYSFKWHSFYPQTWDSVIQSQRDPSQGDLCEPLTPHRPCVLGCSCSTIPRDSNVLARLPFSLTNNLVLQDSALNHLHHPPWSSFSPLYRGPTIPFLGSHCNSFFLFKSLHIIALICLCLFLSVSLHCKSVLLTSYLLLLAQWQIAFQKCVYQFNLPLLGHEKAGIIFLNICIVSLGEKWYFGVMSIFLIRETVFCYS